MSQLVQVPFDEAILDATGGNPKVLTSSLANTGCFPVVDQGQEFVAGYVDDENLVCRRSNDAVILFGDHTKVIKYVDFDFVLGADGVKVLEARPGFDPRFLFHYLNTIRLPDDLGYSRHFKYLKRSTVPKLPIEEQRRIAAILDKADGIRRARNRLLIDADALIRSSTLQLLNGLPLSRVAIEELLPIAPNSIRTGPFGSQLLHSEFTDSGIPVLGIDNVVTNRFRWAERRYISKEKYRELRRYRVFSGDVMITIMGTTGRVCIAPNDLPECVSTKHLCTITPDRQRLLPEYLWASLLWDPIVRAQAAREGKGAIMEGWNMSLVRGLLIKLPTIAQQERFAAFVNKVEVLRAKLQTAETESNELFSSLAQKAFSGNL